MKKLNTFLCFLGLHVPSRYKLTDVHISILRYKIYTYEANCIHCNKLLIETKEENLINY